jgi:hypothetical protein
MSFPSVPTGYDVAKHVHAGRTDCHLTVGFDRERSHIPRFLVQLHHQTATDPIQWDPIARMDHNETSSMGHDVYQEGLHVDVARRSTRTVHLGVSHPPLPANRGYVVRGCVDYFRQETNYFITVYEERRRPGRPPRWSPDGGESAGTFISPNLLEETMSRKAPVEEEDVLSVEELTELLAEATDTTPEDIERGAAELALAPPEEAQVVEYGERGSLNERDGE